MNKRITLLAFVMLAILSTTFSQEKKAAWPEMKKFHSIMSATFHPSEDGDLAPLKSKADSLLLKAKLWQASVMPANFKPEQTKAALAKLVAQCETIKTAVDEKTPDEKLKELISQAHDIFHNIVGECRKADE